MPAVLRKKGFIVLRGKTSGKKRLSRRSIEDRDKLVLQWQYLPQHVVAHITPKGMCRADYDDAEGQAFLALVRAAETWKESGAAAFNTYAYRTIALWVARLLRHRGLIHVPENAMKLQAKEWSKECRKKASRFCTLPDGFDIPEQEYEKTDFDEIEKLQATLKWLPDRERVIVVGYIGEGRTLLSLGKELNLSKERVRQIKDEALFKLRARNYCPSPKVSSTEFSLKRGSGRRPTVFLTQDGVRRSISDWSLVLGISKSTLWSRWLRGLSTEKILAVPLQNS